MTTRPLSATENYLRCRTLSGFYKNFQVTATYSHSLSNNLDIFYKALRKTLLDHHIFICNVFREIHSNNWTFKPIKKLKLGDILSIENENQYLSDGKINESFMKYINTIVFEHGKDVPLFKLFLIGDQTLCAVFEHSIADGLSGMGFHETLLENINFVIENGNELQYDLKYGRVLNKCNLNSVLFNFDIDNKRLVNPLPYPIDHFLSIEDEMKDTSLKEYSNQLESNHNLKKWEGRFPSDIKDLLTFKLIHFTQEETNSIIQRCREEETAITSFITVVNALTWQPIFDENRYTTHKVALSLRRHIAERKDKKYFGALAHTGISELLPPIDKFSWNLVRDINDNLKLTANDQNILNSFIPFISGIDERQNNKSFFLDQIGGPSIDNVKISNLGLFKPIKFCGNNSWKINNMIFSQDLPPSASDFMLNIVSTTAGGMNIVLSYVDSIEKDSHQIMYDSYIQKLKDNILHFSLI